jgi:hypothetical protein
MAKSTTWFVDFPKLVALAASVELIATGVLSMMAQPGE